MAGKDKVLWTFIASDFLFLLSGGLLIGFALECQAKVGSTSTLDTVASDLLLANAPLSATIANAVIIFLTFIVSIPAMIMPTTRGWLKLHGFLTFVCLLFTLILGLVIWFGTLTTRSNLLEIWTAQPAATQSLLQQQLDCCGYINSATPIFVQDSVCSSPAQAALKIGCVGPFSTFANNYLDLIFTAAFGVVGIDVALILAISMLLKDRKEKERYRHIDQKNGVF